GRAGCARAPPPPRPAAPRRRRWRRPRWWRPGRRRSRSVPVARGGLTATVGQSVHARGDLLLVPVPRGLVVDDVAGPVRKVLLGHPPPRIVVRILVARPVPERARARVVGVPQVDRHLAADAAPDVLPRPPDGDRGPVGLGRRGQV